jgi:hypothetical protein
VERLLAGVLIEGHDVDVRPIGLEVVAGPRDHVAPGCRVRRSEREVAQHEREEELRLVEQVEVARSLGCASSSGDR